MAKNIKIFFSTVICVILIGCSILKSHPKRKSYVSEIGNEIVRCIKEKDKEGLNNMFCDKVKSTEYLKNKIDFIFNYIDEHAGIIIEDGVWKYPASHGTYDGSGSKSVQYYYCKYTGKVFIDKKQYELIFDAYQVLKHHKDYEGIIKFSIREYKNYEMVEKSLEYQEKNNVDRTEYLGFNMYNTDYNTFQSISILPKKLDENKEYEIPINLEDDR